MFSQKLKEYDFGPDHPFRGDRFVNFMRLFKRLDLDKHPEINIVEPKPAGDDVLSLVHDEEYIALIKSLSRKGGVLTPDTPVRPGMYDAARLIAGSSVMAADLVQRGRYGIGIAIGGGLHHAARYRGGGFCLFNDVAICAAYLLERHKLERVMVLDTDAHAGDGTSEVFYADKRVLFISVHQDPLTLYPGTGFANEIGEGDGKGYNVNVPLPPTASDKSYEYVFDELVTTLAEQFSPEIIVRNGGSDPHFADRLTNLCLTLRGFTMIGNRTRELADKLCEGKIVDCIGSGYNKRVLPYAWLASIAGLLRLDLKLEEPVSPPEWLGGTDVLDRTREVVRNVKEHLDPYWKLKR